VIEHANAHELTHVDQALGDDEVFFRGFRVTTGVVVHQYHAGGGGQDSGLEDFAGVNDAAVEATDGDYPGGYVLVASVQEHDQEVLALLGGEASALQKVQDVIWALDGAQGLGMAAMAEAVGYVVGHWGLSCRRRRRA
jgi:hypothetical protein